MIAARRTSAALAGTCLVAALLAGCSPSTAPGPEPSAPQSGPSAGTAGATPSAAPSAAVPVELEAPPPPPSIGPDGISRSGVTASGDFSTNTVALPPGSTQPNPRNYMVLVETSLPLDADAVAPVVHSILDNRLGWTGYRGNSFNLVADPASAELQIRLAAPQTVDTACGALGTGGVWSCRVGNSVWLNVDRWFYATPAWADESIDEYRVYLVNHEVGHFLGLGHVGCPEAGAPSPVMQQQSIALNGCVPNGWPAISGEVFG